MKQIKIIEKLTNSYPSISLMEGETFYWSPAEEVVYYRPDNTTDEGSWALLHETGHALLKHTKYYSDIELVLMEVEAWEEAKSMAKDMKITIDEDHIQDCLDSYREWLHKRSLCPQCELSGIQLDVKTYTCIFCQEKWNVSSDRFCRPYRRSLKAS